MRKKLTKRQYLSRAGTVIGTAASIGLAGCNSSGGNETGTAEGPGSAYDETLPVLLPDGDIQIPFYLSPEVQDYFAEQAVDIEPQVTAYEQSSRALTTGSAQINPAAPAEWITMLDSGGDIDLVGGEVKQINGIFTLPGTDIEEPQDLEGATVGLPYLNSGTTKMMGAMLQDSYDIDIREDIEYETAASSVIYDQMVEDEALDAVMLWTGSTVKALANDDVELVMDAIDHWTEISGHAPMILNYGVRSDWLEEYPGSAVGYIRGWDNGVSWAFEENQIENLYEQYGRLAGLTTDAEFNQLLDLFDQGRVLMRDQSNWNEEFLDAQWQLYDLMEETGFIDSAPSRDRGITHSELTDMM